jgi:hypothetical protein
MGLMFWIYRQNGAVIEGHIFRGERIPEGWARTPPESYANGCEIVVLKEIPESKRGPGRPRKVAQ